MLQGLRLLDDDFQLPPDPPVQLGDVGVSFGQLEGNWATAGQLSLAATARGADGSEAMARQMLTSVLRAAKVSLKATSRPRQTPPFSILRAEEGGRR